MSLLDIIDRVAESKLKPFIAPVPVAGRTELFTLQNNIPYWIKARAEAGWHWIDERGKPTGRVVQPREYIAYLDKLPRFLTLALFRTDENTLLVVPFNTSDATQRGWLNGEPKRVHLMRGSPPPLSLIDARQVGGVLLFRYTYPGDASLSDMYSTARKLIETRRAQLASEARKKDIDYQIEKRLAHAGASLIDYEVLPDGYEVRWEIGGDSFRQVFRKDFSCRMPGICLAGTEGMQDLTSIVHVMEEAKKLGRFDYDSRTR